MTLKNKLSLINFIIAIIILAFFVMFSIKISNESAENDYNTNIISMNNIADNQLKIALNVVDNILNKKIYNLEKNCNIISHNENIILSIEKLKTNYNETNENLENIFYDDELFQITKSFYLESNQALEIYDEDNKLIGVQNIKSNIYLEKNMKRINNILKSNNNFTELLSNEDGVYLKTYKYILNENGNKIGILVLTEFLNESFIGEIEDYTLINTIFFNEFGYTGVNNADKKIEKEIIGNVSIFKDLSKKEKIKDVYHNNKLYRMATVKITKNSESIIGIALYTEKEDLNSIIDKKNRIVKLVREIVLIAGIFFLFISLVIYYIDDKVGKRIVKISHVVSKIAKGDLTQEIDFVGDDELGKLSKNINLMAKQLRENFMIEKEWNKDLEIKVAARTKKIEALLQDVENKNMQLTEMNKIKDDFLANTSHELKTPLNGIIGISESLLEGSAGEISDKLRKNISMIVYSGRRLLSLVNDILDFSKMREKSINLSFEEVNIKKIGDFVINLTKPLIDLQKIELINNINDISVYGDKSRLEQIFHNLIGNAVKFTDKGKIEIKSRVDGDLLEIIVEDTGIGISKEKMESIFMTFEQGDGSISREYGGTGLGLSLTKQLIELHGGKIWVESNIREGSKFYFTIPIYNKQKTYNKKQNQVEKNEIIIENLKLDTFTVDTVNANKIKGKILLVDDEIINLNVLNNYLSIKEYELDTAVNGEEVLNKIFNENKRYDLIVLDVMMPRMSGYEVCKKLRETFSIYDLPILMLTAKSRQEDIEEGFKSGANDYLTKPVHKTELYARVETLLSMKNSVENAILSTKQAEKERQEKIFSNKMRDFTKNLSSTLIVKEVLNKLIEKIHDIIDFDRAVILLKENNGNFNIITSMGIKIDLNFNILKKNKELKEKIRDINSTLYFEKIYLKDSEVDDLIVVPLVYRGNVIGLFVIEIKEKYDEIQDRLGIIESFSGQVGFAIENAKLFEEIEKKRKEIENMFEKVKTLENLVSMIYTEKDIKKAIDYVLMLIVSKYGLSYKKGIFLEYNEKENSIIGKNYFYNFSNDSVNEDSLQEIQDIVEYEEANIKLVNIDLNNVNSCFHNIFEKEILYGNTKDLNYVVKNYNFKNYIILPVYYHSNKYGVIVIDSKKKIDEDNINKIRDILKIFTLNLAIYFENQKLEDDALKTAKFKTMVDLSKAIVHEIRSPLATIDGFSKMTKSKISELNDGAVVDLKEHNKTKEKMEKYLETIGKEVKRVDEMATDLLEYSSLKNIILDIKTFNLTDLIEEILEDRKKDIEDNNIQIIKKLDNNINLNGDFSKLKKSIFHIVKNSIEALDYEKSENFIEIFTQKQDEIIIISIKDNGIGINKDKLEEIYEPMNTTKIQGTGLGLTIVLGIIEKHNGKLIINSKEKVETEVKIILNKL